MSKKEQFDREKHFDEHGNFAKGNPGGPGRRPDSEKAKYERIANKQYRDWTEEFSLGWGEKWLPSSVITLLKSAKIAFATTLYLETIKQPTDSQVRNLNQGLSLIARLLSEAREIMMDWEEPEEDD